MAKADYPNVNGDVDGIQDLALPYLKYCDLLGALVGIFQAAVQSLRDLYLSIIPTRTATLFSGNLLVVGLWGCPVPFAAFTTSTYRPAHRTKYISEGLRAEPSSTPRGK